MKKIAIITMNGNNNYGNKLQHYAVQETLKKYGFEVSTLAFWNYNKYEFLLKNFVKILTKKRYRNFKRFDKRIKYSKSIFYKNKKYKISDNFDYYVVGSDQVWNSTISSFRTFYLLDFVPENKKKISFSASFGTDYIENKYLKAFQDNLQKFNKISVREVAGYNLINQILGRDDVEVLVDPTMLLTTDEWNKVIKKPNEYNGEKYILNYFLGDISNEKNNFINEIAKKYDCKIINLLNPSDPYYSSGPSEFLWLEKNATLICTDSFHSTVFSIIYNKPFIVFERQQKGLKNINSRIDTLLKTFKLENRWYDSQKMNTNYLEHNYTEAYKILNNERKKSANFLRDALSIKDSE